MLQHLLSSLRKMTIQIEEVLLWKLFQFLDYYQSDVEMELIEESSFDSQRSVVPICLPGCTQETWAKDITDEFVLLLFYSCEMTCDTFPSKRLPSS